MEVLKVCVLVQSFPSTFSDGNSCTQRAPLMPGNLDAHNSSRILSPPHGKKQKAMTDKAASHQSKGRAIPCAQDLLQPQIARRKLTPEQPVVIWSSKGFLLLLLCAFLTLSCRRQQNEAESQANEARRAEIGRAAQARLDAIKGYVNGLDFSRMPRATSPYVVEKILVLDGLTEGIWGEGQHLTGSDPFTNNIEDAGTVVLINKSSDQVGEYSDGKPAYRVSYEMKIIDKKARMLIEERRFEGEDPPRSKSGRGEATGNPPPAITIINYLRSLPHK